MTVGGIIDMKGIYIEAPVGTPVEVYIDNIYNLSRWAHTHIDNLINPLTNLPMEKNEQWYWWVRIRFKKTWSYDKELDYEDLYKCMAEQKEDKKKKDVMSWW